MYAGGCGVGLQPAGQGKMLLNYDFQEHWRLELKYVTSHDSSTQLMVTDFESAFNLFSDLLLAVLPVPMIWKLQTNVRTRISLCIILSLGLLYV